MLESCHNKLSTGLLSLLVILVLQLTPMNAWAENKMLSRSPQEVSGRIGTERTQPRKALVQDGSFVLGRKVSPFARLGFQRVAMDLRVPTPFTFSVNNDRIIGGGAIILTIQGANLWMGEAGLDIVWSERLSFSLKGSGNLMQRLALSIAPDLVDAATLTDWRKNDFRWIVLEGAGEYAVWPPCTLVMGARWDHFLLVVNEPLRTEGTAANGQGRIIPSGADMRTDFVIPYVGIGIRSDAVKAQVIGSVFPYSTIQFRTRFSSQINPSTNVAGIGEVNFFGLGGFVEAGCDYTTKVLPQLKVSFWGRAGLLTAHGQAGRETSYTSTTSGLRVEGATSDRTLRFFRHNFTGGIALEGQF